MKRPPQPAPPALAGVDLEAHRERAMRALVLFFGNDLSRSPAEWEERARAVLGQLAIYGVAPVWLGDPAFAADQGDSINLIRDITPAARLLGGGPGA